MKGNKTMKKSKKTKKANSKINNSNKKGTNKMEIKFDHLTTEEFINIMKDFEDNLEKNYAYIDSELRKYNSEFLKQKIILTEYFLCKYACETVDSLIDKSNESFDLLDKAIRTLNAACDHIPTSNYYMAFYYMYLEGMKFRFQGLANLLALHDSYNEGRKEFLENYRANVHKGGCN